MNRLLLLLLFSSTFSQKIPLSKRSQLSSQENIDFSEAQHHIARIHSKYRNAAEIIDLAARKHRTIPMTGSAHPDPRVEAWKDVNMDWYQPSHIKRDLPDIIQDPEPIPSVIIPPFLGFRGGVAKEEEVEPKIESRATRSKPSTSTTTNSNTGATGSLTESTGAFLASISIGTPPEYHQITVDTGSGDLWIPKQAYDPSKSTTSKSIDKTFEIGYGDGTNVTGKQFNDVVAFGDLSVSTTFGAGTNSVGNGILGLAFLESSQLNTSPFFQSLVSEGKVSNPQFSIKLDSSPELLLGGMDSTYIVAESTEWYSVQSNSFWMVSGNAHFNGSAIISGFNAIIDSGTSVIVAPTVAAKSFWAAIPNSAPYGNGYYTYDCDTPPSISFSFHNGPALWQLTVVSLGKVSASSSRCVGSIVGQDIGVNAWVLGDSFMAGVYSTFDFGTNQIGFSKLS